MNVVVDDQGEPLLMDFGCSSFVNESGHAISSPSDQLRGTPRHMPPEKNAIRVLPHNSSVGYLVFCDAMHRGRSFFFCWFFILNLYGIQLFTNQCRFDHIANDGAVVVEVLVRCTHPPRPRGPFAAQLTDDIWDVLKRCWEFDPSRRVSIDTIEVSFALHRP